MTDSNLHVELHRLLAALAEARGRLFVVRWMLIAMRLLEALT